MNIRRKLGNRVLLKYIYKELLLYFLICFSFLFVAFFVNSILLLQEKLLAQHTPVKDVMLILFYNLPAVIAQTTPYATLTGFVMCLGRMAGDNEILVLRACGLSYSFFLRPVIILGLVIGLISFVANDYLTAWGTLKSNKQMMKITKSTPSVLLESNSVRKIGNASVISGEVQDTHVSDLVFISKNNDGNYSIISSGDADLIGAKDEGVLLQLNMDNTDMITFTSKDYEDYDVMVSGKTLLNIFDSVVSTSGTGSAREMVSTDVKKYIDKLKQDPVGNEHRILVWEMEYYKKFSFSVGTFLFAILAFSISFLFKRHHALLTGLIFSILICVVNWALSISGQLLVARLEWNPVLCIWGPDVLIAVAALIFGLRLLKK